MTIAPRTIPLERREVGATGNGVGVTVAVAVTGRVTVEVGIPKVTVRVGVGVSVLTSGLMINSVCPMKIALLLRLLSNFNCSTEVL